jgi:hypothetical protein
VRAQIAAQMAARGGGRQGGAPGAGGATATSRGDVALTEQQGGQGGQGGGGFQMPDVSDKDCAAVTAAFAKKPAEKAKLDALRQQMMSGTMDRDAMRAESQKIYAAVGVDARVAGACRRKEMQAGGGGGAQRGAGAPAGAAAGAQGARGAGNGGRGNRGQGGAGAPGLNIGGSEVASTGARRSRAGLVFVKKNDTFEPRLVQLGASNFDYTEVVSGLKEGEQVALLAAAALQAQRQQQNDRMRQNSGVPGMQQQAPAGGAGGGGNRGGGGGRGPGG